MSCPGAKMAPRHASRPWRKPIAPTLGGGTLTSAGYIPHLKHRGIHCPVMLEVVRLPIGGAQLYTNHNGLPYPVRTRGGYRYALPGGGFVEGPRNRG
jgi:hypothetical protein